MIRTFYRLGRLYAASPMLVLLAIVCSSAVVGLSLTIPWILKEVLDYGLAQRQMRFLYLAGALLIAVTVVRGAVAYGQSYLTAHLAQHLAYRLRHLLYDQIQRSSFAYHDRAQTGELMSRATADVEAVRLFFQFGWPIGLSVALAGAGTMVAMAWLDWRLLGLTLVSLPFFLGVILGIGRLLRPLQVWVQEKTGDLTVALQESLAGIRVVKAFARERQQIEGFARGCRGPGPGPYCGRCQGSRKFSALDVATVSGRGLDAVYWRPTGHRRGDEPGHVSRSHKLSGPTGPAATASELANGYGLALSGRGRTPLCNSRCHPRRPGCSAGPSPATSRRMGTVRARELSLQRERPGAARHYLQRGAGPGHCPAGQHREWEEHHRAIDAALLRRHEWLHHD